MRRHIVSLLALLTLTIPVGAAETFHAFAYHDVRDSVAGLDQDRYAISTANLIAHFSWLQNNGYVPVSMDDIAAARDGRRELPDRAVLLTFDDGLKSTYTHVFPLLKLFGYPAVISLVTNWVETEETVPYAGIPLAADDFITWDEVREMQDSGLVEIASHSFDMHRGIHGNPQGNLQPAMVTRKFDGRNYESASAYRSRVATDVRRSVADIRGGTGKAPRIFTWPYGLYNSDTAEIAAEHEFEISLTLEDGANRLDDLDRIRRYLIIGNPGVRSFAETLVLPPSSRIVRAAQVDLDYVFDADPDQQKANLDALLDRIKALEISHVFLQAFADSDADGAAEALYFPNRHLPVRADLFNRVAWQLKTRSGVRVYAWMPLLGFVSDEFDKSWRVAESRNGEIGLPSTGEPRLSPFHPDSRRVITEMYEDLAAYTSFDGILFHDDGRLNEFEDANAHALARYQEELGNSFSIAEARADPEIAHEWARLKTRALIDFSRSLTDIVRHYRPGIKTARNLFAGTVQRPESEIWLAQNFSDFLESYDYVALMAMPHLENAPEPEQFFERLVTEVVQHPGGADGTIFQLQTVDWRDGSRLPAEQLAQRMRSLQAAGIRHLAYYPDDFIVGHPELEALRQGISLAMYPYRR